MIFERRIMPSATFPNSVIQLEAANAQSSCLEAGPTSKLSPNEHNVFLSTIHFSSTDLLTMLDIIPATR